MELLGIHVMIDLETLGKRHNAAILSIGAVAFTKDKAVSTLSVDIDPESCEAMGLTLDASTVMWWMKQSDEARKLLTHSFKKSLCEALNDFEEWFPEGVQGVWGNGATFDNVILANAFDAIQVARPWPYFKDRCYRTVKNLHLDIIESTFEGVKHSALADAWHQARHLSKIANGGEHKW